MTKDSKSSPSSKPPESQNPPKPPIIHQGKVHKRQEEPPTSAEIREQR